MPKLILNFWRVRETLSGLPLYILGPVALNISMMIYRQFAIVVAVLLTGLCLSLPAHAKDKRLDNAPDFSAQTIEARIKTLDENTILSEEQLAQARGFYMTASDQLEQATQQEQRRNQYLSTVKNIDKTRKTLTQETAKAREDLERELKPMKENIGAEELSVLEKDLVAKESELAAIQSELSGIDTVMQSFSARQTAIPTELTEARAKIGELQSALEALGDGKLETVSEARRFSLQARIWFRRNQIATLEQEIATLPERQELLTSRRTLADLQAQILHRDVQHLSERTGQKRFKEAQSLRSQVAAQIDALQSTHPLFLKFAQGNLDLADQIAEFAQEESEISKLTAAARGREVNVKNDLTAASELVALGHLDREAGVTLRRLGNQLPPPEDVQEAINETQTRLATATRQRVVAQEGLRDFSNSISGLEEALAALRLDDPTLPDLSEDDRADLLKLIDMRREILRQISSQATSRINDISQLQAAQTELLERTQDLSNLLDENLLWVRSVPAINKDFPRKVILGAVELFSLKNLRLGAAALLGTMQRFWPLSIGFLLIVALLVRFRSHLRTEMKRRSAMVGRVRDDTAWHTPFVVLASLIYALPVPLVLLFLALLCRLSGSQEHFIEGLRLALVYLAGIVWLFLSWVEWNCDEGLFAVHFKASAEFRQNITKNLKWFVPFFGVSSTLLVLSIPMSDPNIMEGFCVFVFILSALALAFFAGRVLWTDWKNISRSFPSDAIFVRFHLPIAALVIGLPFIAAILAMFGYYESAAELLIRFCASVGLILLSYIIYGSIRRSIIVAQRQLKYRKALERREAEIRARREKQEAEKHGVELPPPPPIDPRELDVYTITQQTSRILRMAVLIAFVGALWVIWSPLLPAFSIFDGFEIWHYVAGIDEETGANIIQSVSIWDVVQAALILTLAIIAARNLPGVLEILVLNRMGMDAGARYAVETVLGYIIIAIGIIVGFNQLGLQWSQLKWIATGLSVGIGFGLQKVIANFISGLIILFERPIRIGDYVTIGTESGTVTRIKIRATTLQDLDNLEILIPNESLISERVTNWTLSSSVTRLIVPLGIAYGSDTDKARDLMLKTLKDIPKVLDTPAPQVLFVGFGDSALEFELRVFLHCFEDRVPMRHIIHTEIYRAFEKAGISIPFPQQDLNIVSQKIPLQIAQEAPPRKRKGLRKGKEA